MNTREAKELGAEVGRLVQAGRPGEAYALLAPVLAKRTPFPLLGRVGAAVGAGSLDKVDAFLNYVAVDKTEGGWVVIGTALGRQLDRDLGGAFARCRDFIIAAGVWYATDILSERVPGPALVADFLPALAMLGPWREDRDRWVRRAVGVAVHYWAIRSRGAAELAARAESLLALLEPLFEDWEMDTVKGVGWGLKTLGKYYPDLVADWLAEQVVHRGRRHRALMLRKAVTFLAEEQRARATGSDLEA